MSFFYTAIFIFLFLYGAILFVLALGFLSMRKIKASAPSTIPLSLIICARNEEFTIVNCLHSILQQQYDLKSVQIILVDDCSSDKTTEKAEMALHSSGVSFVIIKNKDHLGKKASITAAITLAENELLVLRDADTLTDSPLWLQTIASFYSNGKYDLIIAPVAILNSFGPLWAIQAIENNVLAVMAAGSAYFRNPFLNNGANLAFTKTIFSKVNGYETHKHIASGDDILFLESVKKVQAARIGYLKSKESIVLTYHARSLKQLFSQKFRWASKFKHNKNTLNYSLAVVSFIVNASFIYCLLSVIFKYGSPEHSTLFLIFKLAIDFLLLFLSSTFIKTKQLLRYALPLSLLYPVYACVISIGSLFMKVKWKQTIVL